MKVCTTINRSDEANRQVVKASKVLDDHFTGLSVHRVDVVEIMKTFSIGVVVGDGKLVLPRSSFVFFLEND